MKCKQIWEEILPYDHPYLSIIYNNLGKFKEHDGKHEESLHYLSKSNLIREISLSSNHSHLAINFANDNSLSNCAAYIKSYPKTQNSNKVLTPQEYKINAKTEYDFLDKLKIYKNYFLEPYSIKDIQGGATISMQKRWCLYSH